MIAFLITVFRRIKGICLSSRKSTFFFFLYMVGDWERKESFKVDGMITDQGEGSNHWGLESSSVTLTIQTAWSCPVSREPALPARLVVRPPPWMGEKLLSWSRLLRADIPQPRSSCGYDCPSPLEKVSLVLQGQFLTVEEDFMNSGRTEKIQVGFCFFLKKKNSSSSAVSYLALIISML